MDYAFAPGVTDYDELMRKLLINRKTATRNTELIREKKLTTVARFFAHLKNAPAAQIPKPVGDLLIASHGNDLGWMQIDLVGGGAKMTNYDELTRIKNNPQDAAKVKLPEPLYTNPNGTLAALTIRIRGCRIGESEPFVDRLQEVFGGAVPVTAPKHLHYVWELTSHGMFEFLAYGFTVVQPTAFTKRSDVVDAFKAKGHRFVLNRTDERGVHVPDEKWDRWIPKFWIPALIKASFLFPVALGRSIESTNPERRIAAVSTLNVKREFRHMRQRFRWPLAVSSDPGTPVARQQLVESNMRTNAGFQPGGDYLLQFDYPNVDAFLNAFSWSFSYSKKNKEVIGVGTRHLYMVVVPLTDPTVDPDPETGPLLFNYYPTDGLSFDPIETLSDSDAALFYTATP